MQKIYCFENAINFIKTGITSLSLLILLNVTAYSNPIDKNADRKAGYNFLPEASFTSRPNSKREGFYSTNDCTYTLSSNSVVSSAAGSGTVTVTTGDACTWTATKNNDVYWITITTSLSGTGNGSVGYTYTANTGTTPWSSRTGTITIAGKTYTVTQLPPSLTPDRYEESGGNNTSDQAYTFSSPVFNNENLSTLAIDANCHIVEDIDFYKINLEAGYSYTINGTLYGWTNNYLKNSQLILTLPAKISYSTNGTDWSPWGTTYVRDPLSTKVVQAGTLYLKIEPYTAGSVGAYAARINIKKAAKTDCIYTLSNPDKTATLDAGTGQVDVTTEGSSCAWTATSNDSWIKLTSGQSTTGTGSVAYTYNANMAAASRTGTITIAAQTYTVTQAARPLTEAADSNEPNNTVGNATSLTAAFIENVSTISISANCHINEDVDIYKINLETGYSYALNGELYTSFNQINGSNYTLLAKISYSTDNGSTWNNWRTSRESASRESEQSKIVPAGTLYLKIEPYQNEGIGRTGTYAAKIEIKKAAATGCTYTLPVREEEITWEAKTGQQVEVRTNNSSCVRTATSRTDWITLISGQSGTGTGYVVYSCEANISNSSRQGTIAVADKIYTVRQGIQPDGYETNNTAENATSLPATYTDDASTVSISNVNFHSGLDIDFYKINLEAGYHYTISGELYDNYYDPDNSNYTVNADAFYYSTDGSTWNRWGKTQLPSKAVTGGETLYLKIKPYNEGWVGTYAAKINISRTTGCTYSLSLKSKQQTAEAGTGRVTVTASSLCNSPWTATVASGADWITLTSGHSGTTGNGTVVYSYTAIANTALSSRTGTITIAGKTYTVTQVPPSLTPDRYEESGGNNTSDHAYTFPSPVFNNQNPSTVSIIAEANCHDVEDVDFYKINFGAGYSCSVRVMLYEKDNRMGNNDYTLNAKISYSTDGSTWTEGLSRQLWGVTVPGGGSIYFKILPDSHGDVGTYALKIDLNIAGSAGCIFNLSETEKRVAWETASEQIRVTTEPSCFWTAFTDDAWITLTSGQSATGSGNVAYTCRANMSTMSTGQRWGTITVAGQTCYIYQARCPLAETADKYEPNNTITEITQTGTFTPTFTGNASTVSISPAGCHVNSDIDIYKINLEAGYSYTLNGALYGLYNQIDNSNYTLSAQAYYSTNGSDWISWGTGGLSNKTMPGVRLFYLRIEPVWGTGTYAAKIDINRTVDCRPILAFTSNEVSSEAGHAEVALATSSSCSPVSWAATLASNASWWITLTSGQSGTGNGTVAYSYNANTQWSSRTGTITIAGQTYTVTQLPPSLTPDSYEGSEGNNTAAKAYTFSLPVFDNDNASTISISANCHNVEDVDIYKINLEAGFIYTIGGNLYGEYNQIGNSNYTLNAVISYSATGSDWTYRAVGQLSNRTTQAGTLYLKIEPVVKGNVGTYEARIVIKKAGTAGCTYTLSPVSSEPTAEAGNGQIEVTATGSSCLRTATSSERWITLTSGQNETGSGNVAYTYKANMSTYTRSGTISIADQTFTVIQAARPLTADSYEPNNTVAEVGQAGTFTPTFTGNAGTVSISPANCHNNTDIDIYKINLEAGYSYTISGALYNADNQIDNSNYTLNAEAYYSTDGSTWIKWENSQLLNKTIPGVTLYLKITPSSAGSTGTYGAEIKLKKAAATVCTYTLLPGNDKEVTSATATGLVNVETGPSCIWTAASNEDWITLTSGQSGTGNGQVTYSYTENTAWSSRTGTISIADRTYTVTQLPPSLAPDGYEPNNTGEQAYSLTTPAFVENASTVTVSPANCHIVGDVDFYKINLETGYSYTVSGVLYSVNNQNNQLNSNYTLSARASFSTDGSAWSNWDNYRELINKTVQGGETFYIKIEPDYRRTGSYAMSINLRRTTACTYTLSEKNKRAASAAGTGRVTVTTSPLCTIPWRAASNADWITLTSGQNGITGSGDVAFSYSANSAPDSRTGTITIAAQTYTVTQAGTFQADSYEPNNTVAEADLHPLTPTFTQAAGTLSILANFHIKEDEDIYKITLGPDFYTLSVLYEGNTCYLNYSTDGSKWNYMNRTGSQYPIPVMKGNAVYLKFTPDDFKWKASTYSVKINIYTAASISCTYTLPITGREVPAGAGVGKVEVTTNSSCAWAASSNADWIRVTSIQSTAGSGSVGYSYSENTTPNSRTGTITAAGQTYTVTQASIPPDAYEENNTVDKASLLTPLFTQSSSTVSILANCHVKEDVDIYKIDTGADTYAINVVLQNRNSFSAKVSYSTNAGSTTSTWTEPTGSTLQGLTVQGIFYLKIEPKDKSSDWSSVGSYEAGIDINKAATGGCTYTLSADKQATWEAGSGKVEVETTASCTWAAVSQAEWITVASNRSRAGSGSVEYSYTENTSTDSRTGTIAVAGRTYTLTQAAIQADAYEENNTVEQANLRPVLTPVFTQNAGTVSIAPANCHRGDDVDIYKLNLGDDFCIVSGVLYGTNKQINNSRYTLSTKIYCSTDGTKWSEPEKGELSSLTAKGTLYLKIVPATEGATGSYAARISVYKASVAGCTYRLSAAAKQVTWEAGSDRIDLTTTSSCVWAAASGENWITVAAGNLTGSGSLYYSYKENTTASSRTGKITVGDAVYTVTQGPLQADAYEENNTVSQADLRPLTPVFSENTGRLSILSANCHTKADIDIYKINLGTDSCVVNAVLFDRNSYYEEYYNERDRYTLNAQISWSTDGTNWKPSLRSRLSDLGVKGSLYLKIEPSPSYFSDYGGETGSYAVKIVINKAVTAGCTYSLPVAGKETTAEAGYGQAEITANSSCVWTAASQADWISLTSNQSGTGSGSVSYSYTKNTDMVSRTGTITIAAKTYTVTQAAAQSLSPDSYEPNDTKEKAWSFAPVFTQNTSTLSISPANCHYADDVDIYKITLGTGYNSYTVSSELYDKNSDNKNYTLNAQVSYSTDGTTWYKPEGGRLRGLTVAGETLYLKVVSDYSYSSYDYNNRKYPGSYAAKLDITGGCTYTLSPVSKQVTSEAGADQVTVTTRSSGNISCPWTAVSNAEWITFTSLQSGTAAGSVGYAYTQNRSTSSRTGIITIAGQTYTVTQAAAPSLPPDGYEENNTKEEARLLTPVFTQNAGTVSISPANCHTSGDVDIYKINLGNEYASYTVTAVLYDRNNPNDNSRYTLDGELYYTVNGSKWTRSENSRSPSLTVASGDTFYIAILPASGKEAGTYAAKIEITGGCAYALSAVGKEAGFEAGAEQVSVTVNSSAAISCPWTAVSNADWITLTSGQGTGSGNVGYTYTENTTAFYRTGTLTVAGRTYTVIQAGRPLSPDAYEPNNTVAKAALLNPVFTQNVSTLSIAQANCHREDDVDIYNINLEAGTYSATAMLSDSYNHNNYTLDAKISYSTDGSTWSESKDSQWTLTAQGGKLYFRIESYSAKKGNVGTYAAKIDIVKITENCTYSLPATLKQATYQAGSGQVTVTAGSSCAWTATANATWITFTSDQSKTGSGEVSYTYPENMSLNSRTGIITIAGQTYSITQAAHPLSPDGYEENNTVEQAGTSSFTPAFTQNASSISISPANCHHTEDVDIYKINLATGYTYTVSTELFDRSSRVNTNNYTLDARITWSTDGANWSREYSQLPNLTVQGTLYLKITPYYYGNRVGFYAAKIDIKRKDDCAYKLSSVSQVVPAAVGTGKIDVTVTSGSLCHWTATSNTDWLTIKSGQSGTGSGSVEYAYTENNTAASRTGTLTVAGQTFTVTQSVVTGIETTGSVKIFPNPAKDFITIDFSGTRIKYASVKIANQLGQILYVHDSPEQTMQIPVKGLTPGVYFIFLQGEEETRVQKLVVK